jgi:hypothetical protein
MIIKAALPQRSTGLKSACFRCKSPFQQMNEFYNILVLQKQVNMIRHYAPCMEGRSSIADKLGKQVNCRGRQFA